MSPVSFDEIAFRNHGWWDSKFNLKSSNVSQRPLLPSHFISHTHTHTQRERLWLASHTRPFHYYIIRQSLHSLLFGCQSGTPANKRAWKHKFDWIKCHTVKPNSPPSRVWMSVIGDASLSHVRSARTRRVSRIVVRRRKGVTLAKTGDVPGLEIWRAGN